MSNKAYICNYNFTFSSKSGENVKVTFEVPSKFIYSFCWIKFSLLEYWLRVFDFSLDDNTYACKVFISERLYIEPDFLNHRETEPPDKVRTNNFIIGNW